jgi:poly(3-hydroxybutyrate) depolymerase
MIPLLYVLNEFKKAAEYPTNLIAGNSQKILEPFVKQDDSFLNVVHAINNMVYRATITYEKPTFDIEHIDVDGKKISLSLKKVDTKPFCHLINFARDKKPKESLPKMLIVAPMSGHFATLLKDTIATCLQDHDVYVTDWQDARNVPLKHGVFSLDTYVEYLLDFIRVLGQDELHVLAVCQPAVPVLIATSLLASYDEHCQPNSIILMGGPIDTRKNPGAVNQFAQDHDMSWFRKNLVATVPNYYDGSGREIIPGFLMLGGFMALNPDRHQQATFNYFEKLVHGDLESTDFHKKFYDEYRAVMDLPADYFLQSIELVFKTFALPEGKVIWQDYTVSPKDIRKTALLTVEGEMDDISPVGQTYAAHKICKNLHADHKYHYLQKGVGHYGVFSGRRWRTEIYPHIKTLTHKYREKITL